MLYETIAKILTGDRDGTTLWTVALHEIDYSPITDPSEGVWIASLAENILRCGQLQPILLYRNVSADRTRPPYSLIAGRRRIEALRMLGRTHVNAIVVRCDESKAALLSLVDNLVRRPPDFWFLAERIDCLVRTGMDINEIASLLMISVSHVHRLLSLLKLPKHEQAKMRLVRVTQEDAFRLLEFPAVAREMVLDRCCEMPEVTPSEHINKWENLSPAFPRVFKTAIHDTRPFFNSLDRSVEMMRNAEYDVQMRRAEQSDRYVVTIEVAKRPGVAMLVTEGTVSRETFSKPKRRFSSASSIFEAIAEDECALSADVSRETSTIFTTKSEEIAEKLELCID